MEKNPSRHQIFKKKSQKSNAKGEDSNAPTRHSPFPISILDLTPEPDPQFQKDHKKLNVNSKLQGSNSSLPSPNLNFRLRLSHSFPFSDSSSGRVHSPFQSCFCFPLATLHLCSSRSQRRSGDGTPVFPQFNHCLLAPERSRQEGGGEYAWARVQAEG